MQCRRIAWRAACRASNAYSPSLALRAAFGIAATRKSEDERTASSWEATEWGEMTLNGTRIPEGHQKATVKAVAPGPGHGKSKKIVQEGIGHCEQRLQAEEAHTQTQTRHGQEEKDEEKDEDEKKDSTATVESLSFMEERDRDKRLATRMLAHAADRLANGNGMYSLSDPRVWFRCHRGERFLDAESWKPHISKLATLRRQLHLEKSDHSAISALDQQTRMLAFDYAPMVILPRAPTAEQGALPPAPWEVQPKELRLSRTSGYGNAINWLNIEISRFVEFMKPTPVERIARQAATEQVRKFIHESLSPPVQAFTSLEVHGSERNGLAMATSDVDLRIWATDGKTTRKPPFEYSKRMYSRMGHIYKALRKEPQYFSTVTLRDSFHPIINFHHKPSGLDFQIVATSSSKPQEEATRSYLAQIPYLYDLFVVMRTFFEVRGLLSVHNGGIGSYGCFVMLLPPQLRPRSDSIPTSVHDGTKTVGLLRRFLAYYDPRKTINPAEHGVSCFPRQRFKKHDHQPQFNRYMASAQRRGDQVRAAQWRLCQRNEHQPYLLTLQDPANPSNDLGSRTHAIKHILGTMIRTQVLLKQWVDKMTAAEDPTRAYEPFLTHIVGRPDLLDQRQRELLQDYGRSVLANGGESSPHDSNTQEQSDRAEVASGDPESAAPLVRRHNAGMRVRRVLATDRRLD